MALPKVHDRLQPALLDRLRDDAPDERTEGPEQRMLSRSQLREAVLRDLSWLFNCSRAAPDTAADALAHAEHSVLNYGLPALSGRTTSSLDVVSLEAQVRQAILDHEPRILAHTLKVEALVSDEQINQHNQISFRISGQLWAQPLPLELLLHTDIDLETGRVDLRELNR